jgi:conjugal transfer pilus assembly protein TraE
MFSDISHERQQSLLRQRNLFALTSAGLGLALVVAGSLAATRDREVVLVPTVPKALTVSSAGVEADYLELVTRDAALVLLNRSPEGLDYWMNEILKLADPAMAASRPSSSGSSKSSGARTSPRHS